MKVKLITLILFLLFSDVGYSQLNPGSSRGHTFFHKSKPFLVDVEPCKTPENGKIAIEINLILSDQFRDPASPPLFFSAWNNDSDKVGRSVKKLASSFTWNENPIPSFDIPECSEDYYSLTGTIFIDVDECGEEKGISIQEFEFCYEILQDGEFIKLTDENIWQYFDSQCFESAHAHEHATELADPNFKNDDHDYKDNSVPACATLSLNICCPDKNLYGSNTNLTEENDKASLHFHGHKSKTYHIYNLDGNYMGHYHDLSRFTNKFGKLGLFIVVTSENKKITKTEKLILSFD